jgi:hypothetical protein
MAAVAFSIFWADGTADGLWVAEKVGWTGLALVSAKSTWAKSRADAGFDRPGVYVLVSSSPEFEEEVYVGEADVLRTRLNNHYANREWARVVAFTTKDGSLNKAHVKYLESRLMGIAKSTGRAHILNDHPSNLPQLGVVETANVENFLTEMLPLYRLLGVSAFTPVIQTLPVPGPGVAVSPVVYIKSGVVKARGQEVSDGFAVFEATGALEPSKGLSAAFVRLRKHLLDTGVLVVDGDRVRLTKAHVFASPSAAGSVLRGYNVNGRVDWKDDQGVTLKTHQETIAANAAPPTKS